MLNYELSKLEKETILYSQCYKRERMCEKKINLFGALCYPKYFTQILLFNPHYKSVTKISMLPFSKEEN